MVPLCVWIRACCKRVLLPHPFPPSSSGPCLALPVLAMASDSNVAPLFCGIRQKQVEHLDPALVLDLIWRGRSPTSWGGDLGVEVGPRVCERLNSTFVQHWSLDLISRPHRRSAALPQLLRHPAGNHSRVLSCKLRIVSCELPQPFPRVVRSPTPTRSCDRRSVRTRRGSRRTETGRGSGGSRACVCRSRRARRPRP
jgi:hypothetical protein